LWCFVGQNDFSNQKCEEDNYRQTNNIWIVIAATIAIVVTARTVIFAA
jgi:hypothetical protein